MTTDTNSYKIKDYPQELRPRERMEIIGAQNLSDRELLALILATGGRENNVLVLSEGILNKYGGLSGLVGLSQQELMENRGIGQAKATTILAVMEIGKRISSKHLAYRPVITGVDDAVQLLMEKMRYLDREHFQAVLLNTKNAVLEVEDISVGTLNSSLVHPREVFKQAVKKSANAVLLGHNHPSGDPTPSPEDLQITKRLAEAGKLIGIEVLDHIIIGDKSYYSFKEQGLL